VTCGAVVGELTGVAVAEGVDERAGAAAWVVPHAIKAMANAGAISRRFRILAGGFYERRPAESIGCVLRFPAHRRCRERPARSVRCFFISYPWTRVPKDEPPLDRWQLRLLPLADRFMALMWSRPGGLSLRTTWVTPATIGLGLAVVAALGLPGLGVLAYGIGSGQLLLALGGLVAAALGVGGGTVALYGIRQRRLPLH
jgi:hypothetical protein